MAVCPKCGMRIEGRTGLNQNFCPNCGQNLWDGNNNYNYETTNSAESYNLLSAYKSMFRKYAQFKGRSRRSEYWYATLANVILVFLMYIIMMPGFVSVANYGTVSDLQATTMAIVSIIMILYSFAIIIPSLAMGVRRLHDTGKSGWYTLLGLIPYIGSIILIVFMAQDSQRGANQYGPDPKSTF